MKQFEEIARYQKDKDYLKTIQDLENEKEQEEQDEQEITNNKYKFGKYKGDIADFKKIVQGRVGSVFTTNVLRIALNQKEQIIAATLVRNYRIQLDRQMLIRAIRSNQIYFVYCVFAFNKNYERIITDDDFASDDSETE